MTDAASQPQLLQHPRLSALYTHVAATHRFAAEARLAAAAAEAHHVAATTHIGECLHAIGKLADSGALPPPDGFWPTRPDDHLQSGAERNSALAGAYMLAASAAANDAYVAAAAAKSGADYAANMAANPAERTIAPEQIKDMAASAADAYAAAMGSATRARGESDALTAEYESLACQYQKQLGRAPVVAQDAADASADLLDARPSAVEAAPDPAVSALPAGRPVRATDGYEVYYQPHNRAPDKEAGAHE